MRRLRGFTLIELMAVILIIAVATGIVVTNLDYFSPKYSLRAEARMISSNFEFARSSAIRQDKTFSIIYDIDENSYCTLLPAEEDEDGRLIEDERGMAGGVMTKLKYGVKLAEVLLPDGTEVTSGKVQIDITPYGETGSHIVVLEREDNKDMRLYVRMDSYLGTTDFSVDELSFFPEEEEKDERAATP
jgi:prepilin-type N-terminal cleavage/methylation domain-containing protein